MPSLQSRLQLSTKALPDAGQPRPRTPVAQDPQGRWVLRASPKKGRPSFLHDDLKQFLAWLAL